MQNSITLPISTWVDGREWRLFTYSYETPDGTFGGWLYAISKEHASHLLGELKESAVLGDALSGVKNN